MTLKLFLRNLEVTLKEPVPRDSNHAYHLRKLVAEIYDVVWSEYPPNEQVKKEVIPLFVRTINTIRTSSATGQYARHMRGFVWGVNRFIDDLRKNYIKGRKEAA